jgi:hypothetical protein
LQFQLRRCSREVAKAQTSVGAGLDSSLVARSCLECALSGMTSLRDVAGVRGWHFSDMAREPDDVRLPWDIVAKVFLRGGAQILRPAGAAIESGCGGPRREATNSQAILVACLKPY